MIKKYNQRAEDVSLCSSLMTLQEQLKRVVPCH